MWLAKQGASMYAMTRVAVRFMERLKGRHCEERSDAAIHAGMKPWIATAWRPRDDEVGRPRDDEVAWPRDGKSGGAVHGENLCILWELACKRLARDGNAGATRF